MAEFLTLIGALPHSFLIPKTQHSPPGSGIKVKGKECRFLELLPHWALFLILCRHLMPRTPWEVGTPLLVSCMQELGFLTQN